MLLIDRLRMVIVIVLGFVIFAPFAQAEQPFDITMCGSTTRTVIILESEELTIGTFEGKGIARSNLENKVFDNCSYHLLGVARYMMKEATMYGYTKFMDADGDLIVQENFRALGAPGGTWKILYGTGKWKGIKGSGKSKTIARAREITPGTLQSCIRMTGTFELPK